MKTKDTKSSAITIKKIMCKKKRKNYEKLTTWTTTKFCAFFICSNNILFCLSIFCLIHMIKKKTHWMKMIVDYDDVDDDLMNLLFGLCTLFFILSFSDLFLIVHQPIIAPCTSHWQAEREKRERERKLYTINFSFMFCFNILLSQ